MIRNFLVNSSIFVKMVVLFVFALLSFLGFSFYFIKDQAEQDRIRETSAYDYFMNTIGPIARESGNIKVIFQYLKEFGFVKVNNSTIQEKLSRGGNFLPHTTIVNTIKEEDGIYILLETQENATLYKYSPRNSLFNFYVISFVMIVLLSVMFVLLLKAFAPLKLLHSNIKKFANGDLNIKCKLDHKDEIGELAEEFDNAVSKIKALNESRTLFLRSIMHELNTPITKGRLITAMLEEGMPKERLSSVFKRLGSLIEEFAKLEQMNSKTYKMKKREFLLEETINEAKAMLFIEGEDQIIVESKGDLIKADFDLFTLALKNLFDNAIKYGEDKKVYVQSQKQNLLIKNKGQPLKADFKEYLKPYFKEDNSQGFGLGLYIIKNVLESQKFGISYDYQEGYNCFMINGCIVENTSHISTKRKKK